jgi:hypothetical protein
VLASYLANGRHCRVLELALDRDRVEALPEILDAPNQLHLVATPNRLTLRVNPPKNCAVAMRHLLSRSVWLLVIGCGSGSSSTSLGDASSSSDVGACVQTDPSTGSAFACTEYLPGNQTILPVARDNCTGTSSGYTNHWATSCPADRINGCKYPPGAFGVPGGQIVWYYQSAGGCATGGTLVNPDGSPLTDAGAD